MPTISQARSQITQARQTIQQRQQNVAQAESQLQKVRESLPKVTQKSLRQVKDALTARIQREELARVKQDISSREAGLKKFKSDLFSAETGVSSYESKVKKAESKIKKQIQDVEDYKHGRIMALDQKPLGSANKITRQGYNDYINSQAKYEKNLQEFQDDIIEQGGKIQSIDYRTGAIQYTLPSLETSVPTYDTSSSFVSTKTGEIFTPSQKDLPDWVERIGFKTREEIRTDPFLSRISEPSILKEDVKDISPSAVSFFAPKIEFERIKYYEILKPLKESETYGELVSTAFPKLIPSIKKTTSDFFIYTPEGRILKDIGKLGIDTTKKIGRSQAKLELRARGIPVTEENIRLFQAQQREFVKTEVSPTLEIGIYGALATPSAISSSFSFFGKTKVPEVKVVPETVTVSKIKYYEDVGGDSFAIRPPPKDIPDNIFFSKTGTVKAGDSYIVSRQIGKIQEGIVKRAAIVKPDLTKLPKLKGKFKDYQKPLDPFRDMPEILRPSGVRVYTGEKPKPKRKRTPFDNTFGMQPSEEIYQLAIKRLKVKPKKVIYQEPPKAKIPKPITYSVIKPEKPIKILETKGGQQLQLLEKPKLKKKPDEIINFAALTEKELAQLKKIRAAAKEQPSLLNIQSELFPTEETIKVTRFIPKEISEGRIKPSSIVSAKEETTTKELDKITQVPTTKPSIMEVSTQIIKTSQKERIRQLQPERLKQPLLLKPALKQPLALEKASVFRQAVRERLKIERIKEEKVKPRKRIPIKERIVSKTSKGKITKVGNLFKVYVRRAGQDILIGTATTLLEARNLLKSVIETTLAASGFIEKGKQRVKGLNLGISFRPAKREPTRVVEKRRRRLKKGGSEVKEILGFKRKKKGGVFGF